MTNNTERKRVIVRTPYEDEGSHYLLTDDQIAVLWKMQEDEYIDSDIEILVIDVEGTTWELV